MIVNNISKYSEDTQRREQANFLNWLIQNPWRIPRCLLWLGWSGFYGIGNRLQRCFTKDLHKRGKKKIKINGAHKVPNLDKNKRALKFPRYPTNYTNSANINTEYIKNTEEKNDIESEFARHRWGFCQYALFGSNEDVKSAVQAAINWISDPPPRSNLAWEPYSASERIANLAVLLAVRPQARHTISDERLRIFFLDTLSWISSHQEYYGKNRTNNHILNNARALTIGGIVIQELSYVSYGLELFSEMSKRMFLTGGYLRERSSHYQVITNNWLLDTLWFGSLAKKHSTKINKRIEEIERLARRVSSATSNMVEMLKGCDSQIGDISPDCEPHISNVRIMRLYPGYFKKLNMCNQSVKKDGWILLSNKGNKLISNFSPKGLPEKFPTHGHSDLGHFIWISSGSCILADPGRCRYNSNPRWISQAKSRWHNLLCINGMGPSVESLEQKKKLYVSPYCNAVIEAKVTPINFSVKHNGFKRIRGVGWHHREVKLFNRRIEIKDQVKGAEFVTIESMLHFDSSFRPKDKNNLLVQSDSRCIRISFLYQNGSSPEIFWEPYDFTSFYGEARCAYRMRARWRGQLPFEVTIVLCDLEK